MVDVQANLYSVKQNVTNVLNVMHLKLGQSPLVKLRDLRFRSNLSLQVLTESAAFTGRESKCSCNVTIVGYGV